MDTSQPVKRERVYNTTDFCYVTVTKSFNHYVVVFVFVVGVSFSFYCLVGIQLFVVVGFLGLLRVLWFGVGIRLYAKGC